MNNCRKNAIPNLQLPLTSAATAEAVSVSTYKVAGLKLKIQFKLM